MTEGMAVQLLLVNEGMTSLDTPINVIATVHDAKAATPMAWLLSVQRQLPQATKKKNCRWQVSGHYHPNITETTKESQIHSNLKQIKKSRKPQRIYVG